MKWKTRKDFLVTRGLVPLDAGDWSTCRMDRGKDHSIRSQHFHQYPGRYSRILCGWSARGYPEHSGVRFHSDSRGCNHRRNLDSVRVASGAQPEVTHEGPAYDHSAGLSCGTARGREKLPCVLI